MSKTLALLLVVALVSWNFPFLKTGLNTPQPSNEVTSKQIASLPNPSPETLGASITIPGWISYTDNDFGFSLQYPESTSLKKSSSGSISISEDKLSILITYEKMSEKDTVNTLAESLVSEKQTRLKEKFILEDTISPIAIDQVTGATFTSFEDGQEITYHFVPLGQGYLFITNLTQNTPEKNLISTSDDIIYSLKLPTESVH